METDRNLREVIRGVGPDVPENVYLRRLNQLVRFVGEFDPDNLTRIRHLVDAIEGNSKRIATVIRATGDIFTHLEPGGVSYTPTIQTDSFRAYLRLDEGLITVFSAGLQGFDDHGRPLDGYQLRLPDGSGSLDWKSREAYQLVFFDSVGHSVKHVSINKPKNVEDLRLIGGRFKQSVQTMIRFASRKNGDNKSTFRY